jgi:broad specificity phosphatase PhoE
MSSQNVIRTFLIRHGESEANVSGILCGQLDSPLTSRGFTQAQLLGSHFKSLSFQCDRCLSSPLSRALETARIATGLKKIELFDELKEHHTGKHSHMLKKDYIAKIDARIEKHHLNESVAFQGGESLVELRDRCYNWFCKTVLTEPNLGQTLALFSHRGALAAIAHGLFGIPLRFFPVLDLKNADYAIILSCKEGDIWVHRLESLNPVSFCQRQVGQ